ncbi:DUF5986 family protein [Clostridium tetani]|uniref:DUF5986 family protein n=1 Tax=Clostridium tetani TaxID=1513 RepID=UPI0003C0CFAC|nr:DUF5986 family protein [Clostridium tetani]CDI50106.1 hypothetical protein BN906_02116 [Clostridium tetani 12124569]
MIKNVNDRIKEKFVAAIKDGLNETRLKAQIEYKEINNAIHFEKMDNIANSLINAFKFESNYRIVKLKRGSYIVVLIFDSENKILFSALSHSRFETLLKRKSHLKTHYIDALVDFNISIGFKRVQQVIDESFFEKNNDEINKIKEQITDVLNGEIPERYVTVCFEMERFSLCNVEAVLTSEHFEVIERDNWSDLIEIDYNDVIYENSISNEDSEELNISIKSEILNQINSSDDLEIPIKDQIKENS